MATTTLHRVPNLRQFALRPIVALSAITVLAFLALPWSFDHKMHTALHGLCAQRPSHTFTFDGRLLPFDARMTGIYLGALVTLAVLVASRAHRWCRQPSVSRLLVLGFLGGIMVVDGFNSLLQDLKLPYPYEPSNWLRLITGMTAGVVLGFALCYLISTSVWKRVDTTRQTLDNWTVLVWIGLILLPIAGLIGSGWSWLFVPFSTILLISALVTISALSLVVIVLLRRRDYSFDGFSDLGGYGLAAVLVAAGAIAALSIGRTLLEAVSGTSSVT